MSRELDIRHRQAYSLTATTSQAPQIWMSERRNTVSPELPSNPAVANTDILLYGVSRRRSFVKSKDDSLLVVTYGSLARCYLRLSLMRGQQLLIEMVIIPVRLR